MVRTSETDPLQISELACGGGFLGLTFCPGKIGPSVFGDDWRRSLETDLDAVSDWRADAVVTLMENEELEMLSVPELGREVEGRGMAWHHLPIVDVSAPGEDFERRWAYHGHVLREQLRAGGRVLVHCRGGRGRTGLLAARLLVELGEEPEAAISMVRVARSGTIETPKQEAHVRDQKRLSGDAIFSDRVLGCLVGGAIGDAFGYTVEFDSLASIRARFGEPGLTEPQLVRGRLVVSDDTQMTLFTAHAMGEGLASVRAAYLDWYETQQGMPSDTKYPRGLQRFPELWHPRAPGNTCLSALRQGGDGTPDRPINDSKGCGGVMRVAPIGLIRECNPEEAFDLAAKAAALTHGHPSGFLSAGVLAALIRLLVDGRDLRGALSESMALLSSFRNSDEVIGAMQLALSLAAAPAIDPAEDIDKLGGGWVGEEALAIAVYSVLRAQSFREAVVIATNHSGDSDSTASIAGQIWGAGDGLDGIPHDWARRLDVLDPICEVATRICARQEAPDSSGIGEPHGR